MKKKWDVLPRDKQQKCLNEVITRVEELEGSEVGIIAAQDIIDIVLENLGPDIYNKALNDVIKKLRVQFADIETELELLEQS